MRIAFAGNPNSGKTTAAAKDTQLQKEPGQGDIPGLFFCCRIERKMDL